MRPRGELRQAIGRAVDALGPTGAATWRGLAQHACVGFEVARGTVRNMAAAGELAVVGQTRAPGVCRPMNLYARPAPEPTGGPALEAVMRSWVDFD